MACPSQERSSSAVIHRGGITSGKPVVSKAHREVEIYRANPEVTISKTSSSPRNAYADNNALASLVDVAVQQPKLPDGKDRLPHGSQLLQRQAYDRQLYERERFGGQLPPGPPVSRAPSGPPVSRAPGGADLIQNVRSERAKQQYLIQDKERFEREAAGIKALPVSSSATLTPVSSGVNLVGQQRMVTASTLIDAIITHSINQGPAAPGTKLPTTSGASVLYARPGDPHPGHDDPHKHLNSSRSPSLKGDHPEDHSSAPGSRPGSRSSLWFTFRRPTRDRSYRSGLKNRLLKRLVAVSSVGGSPGRRRR